MKKKILSIILILAFCVGIVPVLADTDILYITTAYTSPTHYTIDYGTPAYLFNYSINSSTTLLANQSWLLLGSNNQSTIDTLDQQTSIAFTADIEQIFTVASPGSYRFYYLVLEDGFYNPATILTLTLYTTGTAPPPIIHVPVINPSASEIVAPKTGIDIWITDNLTYIIGGLALLVIVLLLSYRRRR